MGYYKYKQIISLYNLSYVKLSLIYIEFDWIIVMIFEVYLKRETFAKSLFIWIIYEHISSVWLWG